MIASGGGHTAYALAVGLRLRELYPRAEITYIVSPDDTWSIKRIKKLDPRAEIIGITKPLHPLEPYYTVFKRVSKTLVESIKNIDDGVILCTGSNHNLLPVVVAKTKHILPIYCVEDVFRFKKKSRTVAILHRFMNINVFLQWREQYKLYPSRSKYVGILYEKPIYSTRDQGYILVVTGTIGHRELFKLLMKTRLENLVIQTGRIDPRLLKRRGWKVFRFNPDIDRLIANASLVIASPGITAINAVQAYGKPTIMVYNPDIVLGASMEEIKIVPEKMGIPFIDPRRIEPRVFEKIVEESYSIKPRRLDNGGLNIAKYFLKILNAS